MQKTVFSTTNYQVILIFIFYLSTFAFSCKTTEQDFCTNPDSVIASEINKRKVVMLGESPHNDFVLYNAMINVIKYWADECVKDMGHEYVLNLILEMDSTAANYIDYYIKTGKDSMINEKISPYVYMEDIECFRNLRKINIYIDTLNIKRKNKIVMNVLGFEDIGFNVDENYLRKNQRDSELWFVNERDKNTSEKLIRYIKSHDGNNHFLMLYGGAHLQNGFVNKNLGFSIPDKETFGYYIAYYLKQEFGEDNILTFIQGMYNFDLFSGTNVEKYSNQNVLIPSNEFPLKHFNPEAYSYWVIRTFHLHYPHSFSFVFSKYIIEKLAEEIEIYEKLLPGFKANQRYTGDLQRIYFITGEKFENSEELRAWLDSKPKFNNLERFDSREFSSFIYSVYLESISNYEMKKLLNNYGFLDGDFNLYSKDSILWKDNWTLINQNAKFINAIGIYWMGYPNEKLIAKNYLTDFSAVDYAEPEKYLQWYRKKFMNYDE